MAWILRQAEWDKTHGIIVIWAQHDSDLPRKFSWSDQDPRLFKADGTYRPRRQIVDGLKDDIRAQLQAERNPPPPDIDTAFPGGGEVIE
jgi:hypothetical protein